MIQMKLIACIAVCFAAAALGSFFTTPSLRPWYASLSKPGWTPPSWLFAPVWTVLYIAMAVAAWLVWQKAGLSSAAMRLFLIQLLLNVMWSALFFRLRSPGMAFGEIVMLWCAILGAAISFWKIVPLAGWLMFPYLVWVTFAAALNFAIWRVNA
jgi:translocator protein